MLFLKQELPNHNLVFFLMLVLLLPEILEIIMQMGQMIFLIRSFLFHLLSLQMWEILQPSPIQQFPTLVLYPASPMMTLMNSFFACGPITGGQVSICWMECFVGLAIIFLLNVYASPCCA